MRPGLLVLIASMAAGLLAPVHAQRPTHGRLFPPEDLGILESPDRDDWQEPERIMDALRIADGARVADLGAGGGWFTIRLAKRVGPNGRVYAEDVQPEMIESIRQRLANQQIRNVETILGHERDPRLPGNLDAVLIVDTYTQFDYPVPVLHQVALALAPDGRLGIVDFKKDGAGGPGPPREERVDPADIKAAAGEAGLRLLSEETFLRFHYLLIFGRR